jgi:CheY-like chemotaxis protein
MLSSSPSHVNERSSVSPSVPPPPSVDLHRSEATHRLVGVRVLVVEDEPDTRELVAAVLERLGAVVTACSNGEDALGTFDAFGPHVVVSDLSLPRLDGWEMIRRLRATPLGRNVPALALSANASLEDAGRALDAGFDVHLSKPISREELVAAVLSVVDVRRC